MQANFYKLTTSPIFKVLPKLVGQVIAQPENNVLLVCRNAQEMKELDALLWTFAQLSFLPHATENDPHPQMQRILLVTDANNNANNANIICPLTYDLPSQAFAKAIFMYEETDSTAYSKILDLHKKLSNDATHQCNTFVQTATGWQKAEHV